MRQGNILFGGAHQMQKLLFSIIFFISATHCFSQDISSPKTVTDKSANDDYIIYEISDSAVFDTTPEQIRGPEFSTVTLRDGFITSKFTSSLGEFERAKRFDLNLQITRKTENPNFEEGVFNLVGPSVAIFPKNSDFGVINAIEHEEYQIHNALGQLHQIEGKFVLLPDDRNQVVFEKVENRNELTLSSGNIRTASQRLKGYVQMKLMEVGANQSFSIRIEFDVINDIRLRD